MVALLKAVGTAKVGALKRQGPQGFALAILAAVALSACGGGGGSSAPSSPTEGATGVGGGTGSTGSTDTPTGPSAADPFNSGAEAFLFNVDDALNASGALDTLAGGTELYGAWNPNADPKLQAPGMKITFFGQAAGCGADSVNGAVADAPSADVLAAVAQMSLASSATDRSWAPAGQAAGCAANVAGDAGPALVYLTTDSKAGGLGLRTMSGLNADGSPKFFGPFGSTGQDGKGTNAGIAGTFVSFRMGWNSANAHHPWLTAAGGAGTARIYSQQSIGASDVTGTPVAGAPVQVKQQMSIGFINSACAASGITQARPCQIKYLLNTAIYRDGVSDWNTQTWFQRAGVIYDPAQGGIPVLDGPVVAAGQSAVEKTTGAALYTSVGMPTQHGAFSNQAFDVRVSFAQLQAFLRLITSQKLGVAVAQVADADLAAMWGPQWNDPAAWELLTAAVGQEVHNTFPERPAMIGGSFKKLYVGPQA